MEKVTLIGNLLTTLSVFFSSSFFIFILIAVLIFFIVKGITINSGKKMTNKLYLLCFVLDFAIIIIKYLDSIIRVLDKAIDNMFVNIYFPSLELYIAIIIISSAMLVVSIIKKKISNVVKKINIFSAVSVLSLFFLSLDTIVTNNIDISADMFLYTNNKLLALVEVSTGIFVLWMLILGVVYFINKVSNWFDIKEAQKSVNITDNGSYNRYNPQPVSNYSTLVDSLLEVKDINKNTVNNNISNDLLIDEYKQMREYLIQLKQNKV